MMTTPPSDAQLTGQAERFALAFRILFVVGALWLLAEYYVPLKQWWAAASSEDQETIREAIRLTLRRTLQLSPAIALLGALKTAERLFARFAQGEFLTEDGARAIGRIGDWLLVAGILGMLGLDGDGGSASLHFRPDIVLAAVGLAVRYIGQVWAKAAGIKADHDQIV